VVAIAITLLAIDLPVPAGDTVHAFWLSARDNDGHYVAFLISFAAIAAAWSNHHDVFRYLKRSDSRFRTLNMAWLLTIVLTPFATKLLTSTGNGTLNVHALRFGFYALLQVLSAAAMLAMVRHMISAHLLAPDTPPRLADEANWGSYVLMLGFGLSIPVLFATTYGWLLWFGVPLVVRRVRHRIAHTGAEPEAAGEPADTELPAELPAVPEPRAGVLCGPS
jgi:uncharacterized membrane protein